ncbi:Glycoside hydrolase family 3 protein [Mycena kentingensis (nom. inval.)]|nr:Glycoside hydrolase family 3 protein [Mycena kentingensis (nom. inval.)]
MRRVSAFFVFLLAGLVLVAAQSQAPEWGQCGGTGWTGPTACVQGAECRKLNDFFFQCVPSNIASTVGTPVGTTTPASSPTSAPSSTSTSAPGAIVSVSNDIEQWRRLRPVQCINISPQWAAAYTKASASVARMSLADKVNLATGVGWENGHCVGNIPAIASIGFPGLCLEDSPAGVRGTDFNSVFPAAINVAATFNRTLMNQRGAAMGAEFRGKGVSKQRALPSLAPGANATNYRNLMRAPAAGRNWEGFGGDPYLSGEGAFQVCTFAQKTLGSAQMSLDDYRDSIGRRPSRGEALPQQRTRALSRDELVDCRRQNRTRLLLRLLDFKLAQNHEIYGLPFLRSVQANVASVMCSYNQINSSFACENDKALNGILKSEFGFQGYVMSDWWATHSTLSVNAGLDMNMPGDVSANSGTTYFGANLTAAVNAGLISQARMTDLATRILAAWYLVGQDSGYPAVNFDTFNSGSSVNQHVNVQGNHAALIRQIGAASTVLLKNTANALPLKAPATIAVVGNGAGNSSRGINGYSDRGGNDGVLGIGWGSGTANYPYLIAPLDAIRTRSAADRSVVTASTSDTDLNAARTAATGKAVALVFITADSGEGYITVEGNAGDRNNLAAWHSGDALVAAVAAVNRNTIVVVNSVGPIIMESWITNANVTAVVWSGLPGQEAGNGLVDILYGAYNPGGRLPYTIGKSATDYVAQVTTNQAGAITPITYSEGIFIDYRHFDQANIAPRFEFGFGLSYTTFAYSALAVSGSTAGGTRQSGPGSSLDPWLHTPVVTVRFSIRNTGALAGTEVPQLYLTFPAAARMAPKNLKGFDSVFIGAGQTTSVTMTLSRFDFATWNVVTQRWELITGTTTISVGASSRDIRLTGSITN